MKKILYFLVNSLIFLIIFSFSHIFYIFGSDFILNIFGRSGYEGIKSTIITIYGLLFLIRLLLYLYKNKLTKKNIKVLKVVGIIISLLSISTLLSINIYGSIFGIYEKYHSLLFFISLLLFFTSTYLGFNKIDYHKIINLILILSTFVYFYSFIQFLGLDPITNLYYTELSTTRATSFFGNANYLAGYILLLLPLYIFINKKNLQILFLFISFIALLTTGSYIGIFLGILYFISLIFYKNKKIFIFVLGIFIIFSGIIFYLLPSEKKGSLIMRPYIWQVTIKAIVNTPKTILVGTGPETLQLVFNKYKTESLLLYSDKKHTADRSHNLFLDFIFFFGIIGGGLIIFLLFKGILISKNNNIRASLILFILFFSFNIPVSIHYIIILLLIAIIYNS